MAPDFERLEKYYQIYRATETQHLFNIVSRSQYVVPVAYKTVETVHPRIISVLFSVTPPIQSRYRMAGPDFKLRNLDSLFGWHFDRKHGYWTVQSWVKDCLIYGQSYLKVGWKQKQRTRSAQVLQKNPDGSPSLDENGAPVMSQQDITETIDDGLDIQNVSIFDLYFSSDAIFPHPFQTSKGVCHHTLKRKSAILAMRDAGAYLDFDDKDLHPSSEPEKLPDQRMRKAMNRETTAQDDKEDPYVDVYEYWEDERLVVTANHRVLLRDEGNPFGLPGIPKKKPFVAMCDNLVPGTLWQIGEVEPLHHTQVEMSTLRRQRTDNNSLIINRMWLYNKDADVDLEALEISRPGGGVGARPIDGSLSNAVQPLVQQDINGASYREFQDLDKDSQEISGLLDYAVGASPERRETATTVQLLQNAANLRFDVKIRNCASSMQELGYMMFERWAQLLTEKIDLRVMEPGSLVPTFVSVDKNSLPDYGAVDLTVPGNPNMLLKDARQQKIQQHIASITQLAAMPPSPLQQAALELEKIALRESEIDGIEPVLALLSPPPPPPMLPPGVPGPMSMLPPGMGMNGGPPPMNGKPPSPPTPALPPQGAGLNERPIMLPHPRPRN